MSAPTFIYPPASTGGTPVGGSGTPDTIPRWATGTTLGNSAITDSGTAVAITGRSTTISAAFASATPQLLVRDTAGGNGALWLSSNHSTQGCTVRSGPVTGGYGFMTLDAFSITFSDSGTPRMTLAAGGNVGIGTASPSHRLAVVGGDIFRHNTFTDASNYKGTRLSSATFSGAEYSTLTVVGIGTFASSNIGLVLQPLGTGAITAQMPDGAATGGNARGANAVDLQTLRATAAQVASGSYSFAAGYAGTASASYAVAMGATNTASGAASVALGAVNTASGERSFAAADSNTASGSRAVAIGQSNTASGANSVAIGVANNVAGGASVALGNDNDILAGATESFAAGYDNEAGGAYSAAMGYRSRTTLRGQMAHASWWFGTKGSGQRSALVPLRTTTDATPTNLTLDGGAPAAGNALVLPANTTWAARVHVVCRSTDSLKYAFYMRQVLIYRAATAASTTLVASTTIGTDQESDAGLDVTIAADTTLGALDIKVTGLAATNLRWVASVELTEVGGTF